MKSLLFVLGISWVLVSCKNETEPSPEVLESGKKVYTTNCVACHGLEGNGQGPAAAAIPVTKPRDFTKGIFKYGSSDEELFKTISRGVPGTAMPSWDSLSEADRKAVIQYIRKFHK